MRKRKSLNCRNCIQISSYFLEGKAYKCEVAGPLCRIVDERLAELVFKERGKPSSIEEIKNFSKLIQGTHAEIKSKIDSNMYQPPSSKEEFTNLIKTLHSSLFGVTKLNFGGQIRKEPVDFGNGDNQRSGVDHDFIEENLSNLFEKEIAGIDLSTSSEEKFLRFCARFLEEFFSIHPFLDGNGRVARLLLSIFAQRTRFRFKEFGSLDLSSDKYISALEYAHRHRTFRLRGEPVVQYGPEDHQPRPKNAYSLLIQWLDKYLERHVSEAPSDQKPAWIKEVD